MGKIYGPLAIILLMIACQGSQNAPVHILSEEEMVKVLADIYETEEKVNSMGLSQDSALQVFNILQAKISSSTGYSDSIVKKSFSYYMEHPRDLDKIYSVLIDTLQLREQRATAGPQ